MKMDTPLQSRERLMKLFIFTDCSSFFLLICTALQKLCCMLSVGRIYVRPIHESHLSSSAHSRVCVHRVTNRVVLPPPSLALSCPESSHYQVCTSSCPRSCSDLTSHLYCAHPCTEGCECAEGYVLSGNRCVRLEDCGCEQGGLYYPRNESFWTGRDCTLRCVCGEEGALSCFNDSCAEGEVCSAQYGPLGCYLRREGVCVLAQTQILSTFDGATLSFPDENSYYLLKLCGPGAHNLTSVEVKIGRKMMNKGPSWLKPVIVRLAGQEVQLGGSDFEKVKVRDQADIPANPARFVANI